MDNEKQLKLNILSTKAQIAKLDLFHALESLRPSHNLPVRVRLEGTRWVCILESDFDILKCPVAYGESPKQACENFDNLWNGNAEFLVDQEEEEEEF